jgi:peptidylprolyl isomerase
MNRWFIVLMATAALTTAGCNKQQESSTTETATETTAEVPVGDTTAAPIAGDTEAEAETLPVTPPQIPPAPVDAATSPGGGAAAPAGATQGAEVTLPGGTKYTDTQVGTGPEAARGSTVSVHYTGTLQDGTKFDSSLDTGSPFELTIGQTQVIKGWTEGLVGMKVGGHRRLVIPPEQGYGAEGAGPIPPNATLLFDIEMLEVK